MPAGPTTDYRRALDIANGIHSTTFSRGGVAFTRDAFASRPDQVMVFRYTAGKNGALSGRLRLISGQPGQRPLPMPRDSRGTP